MSRPRVTTRDGLLYWENEYEQLLKKWILQVKDFEVIEAQYRRAESELEKLKTRLNQAKAKTQKAQRTFNGVRKNSVESAKSCHSLPDVRV